MLYALFFDVTQLLLALFCMRSLFRKKSFFLRFGRNVPDLFRERKEVVWIHAVSVGEAKAAAPLARAIKRQKPNVFLVMSTITETGLVEAKKSVTVADFHFYLPYDFSWIMRRTLKKLSPSLLILVETDFWPNLLRECQKQGVDVVVASGKLSLRSCQLWRRLSWFAPSFFAPVSLFCVQDEGHKKRFLQIGVPEEKVRVTGNLKYDKTAHPKEQISRASIGIGENDLFLVLGSTHDPEEKELFPFIKALLARFPKLCVCIAPRHPERFEEVAKQLEVEIPIGRYSRGLKGERVMLLDAMGKLTSFYQISDLALVAGSFTERVGGHDLLEPCSFSVPVLFGPYIHSQAAIAQSVLDRGAGLQVTLSDFEETVSSLLEQPQRREELGARGKSLVDEGAKITEATWKSIQEKSVNPK